MRLIILIVFYFYTSLSFSESFNKNNVETQFNNAKSLIEKNCTKCMNGSIVGIQKAIEELKGVVSSGRDGKYWSLSMELLGDAYTDMYNYSNSDAKYIKKVRESYKLAYENMNESEVNSRLVLKHALQSQDKKEQLKLLEPILGMQADFSQAKYYQGLALIEEGSVDAGLEALEISVDTALYVNALYFGEEIAEILNRYGRNSYAEKILAKKK